MGETRVDLLHLLEDLRDAYPGALEETILTEVIANSLDSGARHLSFTADPAASSLLVVDDGSGMARRELARYHDIASSTKTRGEGIGFAGVGIKLGLLICEEVVTETRRGATHVATRWSLSSRHKAPWRWIPPPGSVPERGTAVLLRLRNPLSPLADAGFVETTIHHHFAPLLDGAFDEILAVAYPERVAFSVNGRPIPRHGSHMSRVPVAIRVGRKRKPSAVGYLEQSVGPLPEDRQGIAVSTLGKVIKRGWDWLGIPASSADRVTGLIEVPALAESLTLNKADFLRSGPRGITYMAYRKAIQEAVSAQLGVWGDGASRFEEARRRRTRPLERDLEGVLLDLAEAFPIIATLVERKAGGQKRLPMGTPGEGSRSVLSSFDAAPGDGIRPGDASDADEGGAPDAAADASPAPPPSEAPPPDPGAADAESRGAIELPGRMERRKPGRYGLGIQFESRPEDPEVARMVESTVFVNESHPAYRRAAASRSEGYHVALAVGMALAALAAEPSETRAFLRAFLERWGRAIDGPAPRPRRRRASASSRARLLPLLPGPPGAEAG